MKKYLNIISIAMLTIMVLFANISFAATDSELSAQIAEAIVVNTTKRFNFRRGSIK